MNGKKYDQEKLPIGKVLEQFPRAIEAIAMCSKYGHDKYELGDDWQNFRRIDKAEDRLTDAQFRHHLASNKGEIIDPESGLPHEFHALWNNIAKLEIKLEKEEKKRLENKTDVLSQIDEICDEWNNDKNLDTETFYNNIMSLMGYNT